MPVVKKSVKTLTSLRLFGTAYLNADKFSITTQNKKTSKQNRILLLAPEGNGNIGDQAMFDAFLDQNKLPVVVIYTSHDSLNINIESNNIVDEIVLPNLLLGNPVSRLSDVKKFIELASSSSKFLVPGADTMDGGNPLTSLSRLSLLNIANLLGLETYVLGFSWSDTVPVSIQEAMKKVSVAGKLYPRDPISFERLNEIGVLNLNDSADMVFSYDSVQTPPELIEKWVLKNESKFVVLNISGLIHRKIDIINDYVNIVEYLHNKDFNILFLPHVIRQPDNDYEVAKQLYDKVGNSSDLLVNEILQPAQIKYIVSKANFVITGRMHLGIMSLSHNTYPIIMATAGKVEGLYKLFGLDTGLIQPKPGCSKNIIEAINYFVENPQSVKDEISSSIESVTKKSLLNWNYQSDEK